MILNTVIFDMDGLLIDSEPLWYEAAQESLKQFNVHIEEDEYNTTTGLRTPEFLQHWFKVFDINEKYLSSTEEDILKRVTQKITSKGNMMDGVEHALNIFSDAGFKIGLASSSPHSVIDSVLEKIQLKNSFTAVSSAEHLLYGKPHPQVFLDCAAALKSEPTNCICIEDSFNGLIAAKAAKMKCIIVPHSSQYEMDKWNIADLKLKSLRDLEHSSLKKF